MAVLKWDDSLGVGVASVDAQHRQLVGYINALHDALETGEGRGRLGEVFEDLIRYTRDHFTFEEELMHVNGYPGWQEHGLEHVKLTETVLRMRADFESGRELTLDVTRFLCEWLTGHIMGTDRKYVPFIVG
jgi:hemerythrin